MEDAPATLFNLYLLRDLPSLFELIFYYWPGGLHRIAGAQTLGGIMAPQGTQMVSKFKCSGVAKVRQVSVQGKSPNQTSLRMRSLPHRAPVGLRLGGAFRFCRRSQQVQTKERKAAVGG